MDLQVTKDSVMLQTCRGQNIGLLLAYPTKAEWVVSYPKEKATLAVSRFEKEFSEENSTYWQKR